MALDAVRITRVANPSLVDDGELVEGDEVAGGEVTGGCNVGATSSGSASWSLLLVGLGLALLARRRR